MAEKAKTLRFLHLFVTGRGGAGRAARRLHQGLQRLGHESRAILLEQGSIERKFVVGRLFPTTFRYRRLFWKAVRKLTTNQDYYFCDDLMSPPLDRDTIDKAVCYAPDAIIVHLISDLFAPADVLALQNATGAKVVWNLLDMAAFTGGCHFAWDCRKYHTGCGNCPALPWPSDQDMAARTWRGKAEAFARIDGIVVATSSTLVAQARQSALFQDRRIEKVLIGLEPEEFSQHDRVADRKAFGIGDAEQVVFFGTQEFGVKRKGMPLLAEALRLLPAMLPEGTALPTLLTAGKLGKFPDPAALGYTCRHLGFVDGKTLARAYGAADVFICPSIEDSGPMMVNEAVMSGTPVVAFRMGVVPDLVKPGVTGAIAELGDAASLAQCLADVLGWDESRRVDARRACRAVALQEIDWEKQVKAFADIVGKLT